MMSADKFIPTRGLAASETWASSIHSWNRQSGVTVEIFAQSNHSVGPTIIKMPGVSGNSFIF